MEKTNDFSVIADNLGNLINKNLPVFSDEFGAYGSPTSDSEKAMITNDTKNVLTVLIAFSDDAGLEQYMSEATK